LKQGAEFIKVMLGGGLASDTDGIETVEYGEEEVRAITEYGLADGEEDGGCRAHSDSPCFSLALSSSLLCCTFAVPLPCYSGDSNLLRSILDGFFEERIS
jgi:hypothetical protein